MVSKEVLRRSWRVCVLLPMLSYAIPALAQYERCPGKPNAHVIGRTTETLPNGDIKRTTRCECDDGYAGSQGQCVREYRHSPRGLIGGVSWEIGAYAFNPPTSASPEQIAKAREQFFQRWELVTGKKRESFIDPAHYDFIIGVALSSSAITDVSKRALWDNLTKGRATPALQAQYETLRNRSFGTLDCHSNGAMICLAAISNGDIKADKIRLLGPQITPATLQEWDQLAKSQGFQIEIYSADRDPIPVVSYSARYLLPGTTTSDVATKLTEQVLKGSGLKEMAAASVPSAKFTYFKCGADGGFMYTTNCHDIKVYDEFFAGAAK